MRGCACRGTAGFAHVSCTAEQAKILVAEALENNLDDERWHSRWKQWYTCSMCEQKYHGVVMLAVGWACWKTYVGRPEADEIRCAAMGRLGLGLSDARHYADALAVQEAELSTLRRIGASEQNVLIAQGNLATTYQALRRIDEAMRMREDVYSGHLRLHGEEHRETIREANNYAAVLSRASPSGHKNTSDNNSKAVLRISVITLIRTDTTLAARGDARDASRAGSDAAERTS